MTAEARIDVTTTDQIVRECVAQSGERTELWVRFIRSAKVEQMVEVGVYRGDFASKLLKACDFLKRYYMIDPWRHLTHWNKPANKEDRFFEQFLSETKAKTDFAAEKRVILRGKTTEVVDQIFDGQLDFAYIDGDHTLRGIAIDLIRIYPKVRTGGWIGGDDFSRTVWQHPTRFEPTFVFPFAVYFAEAMGARIYALPFAQFLIEKKEARSFAFVDLTGRYDDTTLRDQLRPCQVLKLRITEAFRFVINLAKRAKTFFSG